jgi:ribonuclease HI
VIEIYTDGACPKGNPGPGGWAAIILDNGVLLERLSGGFKRTTNNRMEIMAVLYGLDFIGTEHRVRVYVDSKYAINGMTIWLDKWARNNFIRKEGSRKCALANADLWKKWHAVRGIYTKVEFQWVKAHSSNTWNDLADKEAKEAAMTKAHLDDDGYLAEERTMGAWKGHSNEPARDA